ncbi:hypothetical protein [Clostridium sp.]|uniref:hypothetical protein n=1 Tax=Clostridium sp. TaxID=1506 RepID=UPI001A58AA46|nr:hypothetical protein [Clostridium sp.]MBK5235153.1 hypothetical protein [Clostridium sp.]
MIKDVFSIDMERSIIEQSRIIFFTNEFEKIKGHYKELKDLAIKSNPSDINYIEYLELDFNRAISHFIKEASMID